jgi:hypothetical protein
VTIEQMRKEVASVYPHSKSWQTKVKDMFDDQVLAVYRKFKLQHKI